MVSIRRGGDKRNISAGLLYRFFRLVTGIVTPGLWVSADKNIKQKKIGHDRYTFLAIMTRAKLHTYFSPLPYVELLIVPTYPVYPVHLTDPRKDLQLLMSYPWECMKITRGQRITWRSTTSFVYKEVVPKPSSLSLMSVVCTQRMCMEKERERNSRLSCRVAISSSSSWRCCTAN